MTYRSKVQRPALSLSKGSMFKSLRPAGTTIALTSAIFLLFAIPQSLASSGQTHRHPFSASPFSVHALGRDRSRAFQKI